MIMLNKKGKVPKIIPKEIINPATTFNKTWPATMLAKRRTERVTGRIKNEKSSMVKITGAIHIGTPLGKNICRNPNNPFLNKAKIVMVKNAIIAKESVTTTWLVEVKL